jgi:hypothetical protein
LTLAIAARREVFPRLFKLVATVRSFLLAAQAFPTQQPHENSQTKYFIERIDLVGNRRVRSDPLLALIRPHLGAHTASTRFGAMSGPSGIPGFSTTYAQRSKIAPPCQTGKS